MNQNLFFEPEISAIVVARAVFAIRFTPQIHLDIQHSFAYIPLYSNTERRSVRRNGNEEAMSGKNSEPEEGVAAVERALAILGAFDEGSPVLTLAELASRTGLYKSTISRSLASLRRCGFIERDGSGRYRIGPQAWRVGSLFAVDLDSGKNPPSNNGRTLGGDPRNRRLLCAAAGHQATHAHVHPAR